jgi:hypothetical protein
MAILLIALFFFSIKSPPSPIGKILQKKDLCHLCYKVAYCGLSRNLVDVEIKYIRFFEDNKALLITTDDQAVWLDLDAYATKSLVGQVAKIIPITTRTYSFVNDQERELFRILV